MLALGNGVDKVFLFREAGSGMGLFEASGVIRNDGSLKPSWFTYATLIRMLEGDPRGAQVELAEKNLQAYAWTREGKPVLAVWTVEKDARLPLKLGRCRLTDAFGHGEDIVANGDLPVNDFPQYLTDIESPAALATSSITE